jgi:D-alanyl-D-alanine carboxypeptidase
VIVGVVGAALFVRPALTSHQVKVLAAAPGALRFGPADVAPRPAPKPAALATDWLALHPQPDLDVHAESAVLVDTDTREVVWARDEHSQRPPASLTKLMTVMVASDLAPLDRQVTVPAEVAQLESDSTMMGLSPGDTVSVRELMYGIFLVSGNDAAETLARTLVDRDRFVRLMNEKAAQLGMRDTHFTNPTGLDDPGLRTSAYDLAVAGLTIATRYPDLMPIAGAKDHGYLHSLIKLLVTYPGATGLKTGYTDDAGYCVVGTATRGSRHLVAVVLHSDLALTQDAQRLLDYGFSIPRPETFDLTTVPNV